MDLTKIGLFSILKRYLAIIKNNFGSYLFPFIFGSIVILFLNYLTSTLAIFWGYIIGFIPTAILIYVTSNNVLITTNSNWKNVTKKQIILLVILSVVFYIFLFFYLRIIKLLPSNISSINLVITVIIYITLSLLIYSIISNSKESKHKISDILINSKLFLLKYIIMYIIFEVILFLLLGLLISSFTTIEQRQIFIQAIAICIHALLMPIAFIYIEEKYILIDKYCD